MVREVRVCWDGLPDDFRRGHPFPLSSRPRHSGEHRTSAASKSVARSGQHRAVERQEGPRSVVSVERQRPRSVVKQVNHPERDGGPATRHQERGDQERNLAGRRQVGRSFPADRWSQLTSLPVSDRPRKQVSLFVPPEWWLLLRDEAARQKIPLSELCRRWLLPQVLALAQTPVQALEQTPVQALSQEPVPAPCPVVES